MILFYYTIGWVLGHFNPYGGVDALNSDPK